MFAFLCAGEMVLLLHWSLLNYAGVVKILKKHGERCYRMLHGVHSKGISQTSQVHHTVTAL